VVPLAVEVVALEIQRLQVGIGHLDAFGWSFVSRALRTGRPVRVGGRSHLGLLAMGQSAASVGGTFSVLSDANGTEVRFAWRN
jgi:hypothetical protein